MKLRSLLILSFIATGFIISLIAGIFYYYNSQTTVQNQYGNNMYAIAESRAEHIETYFDDNLEELKLVLTRTQLLNDIENYNKNPTQEGVNIITKKLIDSKNAMKEAESIKFIGLDGIVKASSDKITGENMGYKNFFISGKQDYNAYVIIENGKVNLIFSGPFIQNNQVIGVGVMAINTDELEAIVSNRAGLGESGEVLVAIQLDGKNINLFKTRSGSSALIENKGEIMKEALYGNEGIVINGLDYRNMKVVAASQYIDMVDMGLIAKIDSSEVLSSYRILLLRSLAISGGIIIIISFLVGVLLVARIARPISELTEATRQLQQKNFSIRTNIKSGDEIEELGTSFNQTAEVLENLDKEKEQIDKAKTEFLSITSHELRSPMTPMKAQLQMVLGDYFGKLNKEQRESLQIVLNNTERLDKIIVDFLEISRIEAARLKFNFVQADLTKTLELVVNEMRGFMPEKKIKIETHIEKLPVIEVDPDRVSQVLRNLINNAIKFSPDNGIIEVSAKLHSGMILFSVKDSGVGIAEKDQRKLFEPFYQVENMYQHKSGGTGLGLAISKGIVESQNGKIWLNSQPGRGTIFYFTIPLKPVREIKAIKLLFSETEKIDDEIKEIFREFIGPLGNKEFDNLRDSRGITLESLIEYIRFLSSQGIIKKELAEEFKNKVSLVLNKGEKEKEEIEKHKEVSLEDLKQKGLIK